MTTLPNALARSVSLTDLRAEPRRYDGTASQEELLALAARFDLPAVKTLSWQIESEPWRSGVRLSGHIQAQVIQECVVTLDPVPAEIDERFDRGFLPFVDLYDDSKPGAEYEIVTDSDLGDVPEPLTDPLDIGEILAEELGIALDPYPRSEGLESAAYSAQPAGIEPLTDADVKPFASLADLAKKMNTAKNED